MSSDSEKEAQSEESKRKRVRMEVSDEELTKKSKESPMTKSKDAAEISIEEVPLTCYIHNLPVKWDLKKVNKYVEQHTKFKRVFSEKENIFQKSQKFYVVFETKEQMDKAMQISKVHKVNEFKKVKIHFIPSKWNMFHCLKDHCVLVSRIDGTINEEDLKQYFGSFGKILNVDIHYKVKGLAKGSIFFEDVEVAKKAAKYKNVRICNRSLEVESFDNIWKAPKQKAKTDLLKSAITDKITVPEIPRTLVVRNINEFKSSEDIANVFSEFGEIDRVLSFGQGSLKQFNIIFKIEEGYKNALSSGDLYIGKRLLDIKPTKWNKLKHLQDYFVDINGLTEETTPEDLEEMFKVFGTILKIDVSNVEGYVFFEETESATKALSLNGANLRGNCISVQQTNKKNTKKIAFVKKGILPGTLSKETLLTELKSIGEIDQINEGKNKFTIIFKNEIDAYRAKNLKNFIINGKKFEIEGFNEEKRRKKFGIFIENLSTETDIGQVFKHFRKCGTIVKSYVAKSKFSRTAKKYGYLEFENKVGQTKALKLNRSKLNGEVINLKCIK